MRWQNRLPAGVGIAAAIGSAPPLAKPSSRPSRIAGGVSPESILSSCRKSRFGARSILSGERLEEDHAADEQVQRVYVAPRRKHDEPREQRDAAARVQDELPSRGDGWDRVLHAIHENRVDERRRDHGSHREPADGERERSEIPRGERNQAGGDGKQGSQQEERAPDLHSIRYPAEHHRGDARREREEGEEET